MKFKKRYGARIGSDAEANIIGHELKRLFPNGDATPFEIVEHAREQQSPLHKFFEWDDSKAAEKWRLKQAGTLIRAIVVVVDDKQVPAYHHVRLDEVSNDSAYVELSKCQNSTFLWRQVLEGALREADAWANRYKNYNELRPILAAIAHTKESLNGQSEGTEPENGRGREDDHSGKGGEDRDPEARAQAREDHDRGPFAFVNSSV